MKVCCGVFSDTLKCIPVTLHWDFHFYGKESKQKLYKIMKIKIANYLKFVLLNLL